MELFTNNFRDPMAAASNGLMTGMQIRAVQQAFADQEMIKQREQAFAQDIAAIGQRPTPDAYIGLLSKYPDKAKELRAGYDMLDAEKQKSMLNTVMPVYTALHTGNPHIAKQLADRNISAAENSGDIETAQSLKKFRQAMDVNPQFATGIMGTAVAEILGPEKFKSALSALDVPAAQRSAALDAGTKSLDYERKLFDLEQAKSEAPTKAEANRLDLEIKQLKAQNAPMEIELGNQQAFENVRKARADAGGAELDAQGKRRSAGMPTIPAQLQSKIVDWQLSAETNIKTAQEAKALAGTFRSIGAPGGVFSSAGALWDRMTGSDTPEAKARMALQRFVNSEAIKMLPPGSASDKDIELVSKPFPQGTNDSDLIAEWLDAAERLANTAAKNDMARAEWAETFGTLGKARTSGEVMGIQVMPGTSYNDFFLMQNRFDNAPRPAAGQQSTTPTGGGWSQRRYLQR